MSRLGDHLKELRQQQDRSRRWVERRSRQLHPDDRDRCISHSYLRQIEEGMRDSPSPPKLESLAQIYGADYRRLLAMAGYLSEVSDLPPVTADASTEPRPGAETATTPVEPVSHDVSDAATRAIAALEACGIHADHFLNNVAHLGEESLHLITRLVTTLSVKEQQLVRQGRSQQGVLQGQ